MSIINAINTINQSMKSRLHLLFTG